MNEQQYQELMMNHQLQQQMGINQMQTQQQLMFQEQEKGLANEQLDVNKIIKDIFKLITGKKVSVDLETGNYTWADPDDSILRLNLRILSDYGIQKVMEKVIFYINKSTLLSNYDESEINRVMYDFTTCLNDFILMRYEGFFYEPTFEECKLILNQKIKYKQELRVFIIELLGQDPDINKIRENILLEFEGKVEDEINKIKEDELEKRINEYDSITMQIEHQVFNTYKRAEGGLERSSLRKHASFSEVRTISPEQKKQGGMFGWLKG